MKLIGLARLGNDAEVRFTAQGDPVANLSLAYNYGRKDQSGKQPTQWVSASLWGDRAEKLSEWLTKGRLLYVEVGDLHIEEYQSQHGNGVKLSGRVLHLEFTGKNETEQQGSAPAQQDRQQSYAEAKGRAAPRQSGTQNAQAAYGPGQGAAGLADIDSDCPW